MSDSAAVMTTAASAVCGRSASSELRNSRSTTTRPAPTRPETWLLAPDWSATAVREPLVDTAKPWKSPAAMFAMPMPIISWSGWTSSPRRAAKLVAVAMVSVSDTRVMPTAATTSGHTSLTLVQGTVGVGTPCGSAPTVATPLAERSRTADTTVAPTTATSTAGTRFVNRGSTSRTASTQRPTTSVVPCVFSMLSTNARTLSTNESASVENPNSFGSCPTMMVMPRPFMYPTCTSLASRSATKPSLPTPSPISMSPTRMASIPASSRARCGLPPDSSSGVMAARISGDTDESGPSTSTRDGPNTA